MDTDGQPRDALIRLAWPLTDEEIESVLEQHGRWREHRVVPPHNETPGLGDSIETKKSDWILVSTAILWRAPARPAGL